MVAIAFSPRRFTVTKHCGNKGERSCLRRSRPSVAQFNGDRWQATEKATLPLLEGPSEPKVVCRDFTHTGYDAAGRRTQLIDPLNRRTTSAYDSAGRQTLRLDPRGFRTTYVYDALDRVTSRRYPNGTRATFVFDAVGHRTGMRDATGRCTSTYDTLNRLSQYRTPFAKVLTYVYDDVSNRSRLWESSAGLYTYSYDENNRLSRIINTGSVRTTFVYNGAGQRTVLRQGNGTRTSYSYDAAGQTTQIFHRRSNATSLLQLDYRYDTAGNRQAMIEGAGTARVTWLYDDQNQLTGENRTGTNAYRNTFTFDAAGNRTLKNAGGTRTTYSYDVANQLTYALAAAGRTTYTFDAAGNQRAELTPAGARITTTWNYENQPTVYQLSTGSRVTMSYNADNRRTQKQTAATTSMKFIWEPTTDAYFSELNNSNTNQKLYTIEPVQYGNLISQRVGGDHYVHADALGSTRALVINGNDRLGYVPVRRMGERGGQNRDDGHCAVSVGRGCGVLL